MKKLVRKNILTITAYVAGKPIEEVRRQLGLKEVYKLASNENPLGVSPKAAAAIRKNVFLLNRYPDSNSYYLKKKLAAFLKVAANQIVLGNGSDELIDIIIKTFVAEDENIVTSDVTFVEYKIIGQVHGRKVITAPLKYFKYDLDSLRRKIDSKTKLVFIANPNNPTGTYVTRFELNDFLKAIPKNVIVVLDEAYDTFIDVSDFPDSLSYIKDKNVIVLKTFSKAYGLAGLRIGYALASADCARYMEVTRQPFNVNLLAQVAAEAALSDRKFLQKTRAVVLEGKNYLYAELAKLGIGYVPSVANFLLIDIGSDGQAMFKEMLKYGVIVRDMQQYGLNNFIRVTVGTQKENEIFIKVLKKLI